MARSVTIGDVSKPLPLRRPAEVAGDSASIDLTPFDADPADLGAVLGWLEQA